MDIAMAPREPVWRLGWALISWCAISVPALALSGSKFHAGDRVFTIRGGLAIRAAASPSARVNGTQSGASLGTIAGGPVDVDGRAWWDVDFDSGADGWTVDDFLTAVTAFPLPPLPAPAAPRPLRLRVSAANPHFLEKSDGSPFFWMGDTAWVAMALSPADLDLYFADCASNGLNVSQVVPAWDPFHRPFLEDDTDTPAEECWKKMDWLVSAAERHGIYVAITVMWAQDYDRYLGTGGATARRLGRWLGGRYGGRDNVVWIISGEYDEVASHDLTVFDEMADGIRDGGGAQLKTIHPSNDQATGILSSSVQLHGRPWLAFNMLQTGTVDSSEWTAHDYNLVPAKPVVDGETTYESPPPGFFPADDAAGRHQADFLRRCAYRSVFAGAFGFTYGYVKWSTLKAEGRRQMRHLRSLVESRPIPGRIPDQAVVVAGGGAGPDHPQATRASDGSYAWVYIPAGSAVTVDLTKLAGPHVKASWYGPRDGGRAAIAELGNSGTRAFDPPGGEASGNDWVLVLESAPGGGR